MYSECPEPLILIVDFLSLEIINCLTIYILISISDYMTTTKFRMPVLMVKDISVSKTFYMNLLSLELKYDFGEYIEFKDSISIWQTNRAEEIIFNSEKRFPSIELKHLELYFETTKLGELWKELDDKSIEIIHGLREEPWGQRTLRFFDPDNNIIEVGEPISQVILRLANTGLMVDEIAKKTQMPIKEVRKTLEEFQDSKYEKQL